VAIRHTLMQLTSICKPFQRKLGPKQNLNLYGAGPEPYGADTFFFAQWRRGTKLVLMRGVDMTGHTLILNNMVTRDPDQTTPVNVHHCQH